MTQNMWDVFQESMRRRSDAAHQLHLERKARFNSPEAKAARSEAARKDAATRKRNRAAEQALLEAEEAIEQERWEREPKGPTCGAMDVVMDAQEVFCARPPHTGGDHEDIDGHTWAYEEDDAA
ncbi:hypothetical protein [Streptomyces sp. cg35]|uniref:hypothetical protein n=1 Tax=Streptomyces sp. cg35 TaxID=3421650 RepID=UPI003D17E2A3